MNSADRIYLDGFNAALDLAERAGARILQGQWGNVIRREHAAGGLLAFVGAARESLTDQEGEGAPSPMVSVAQAAKITGVSGDTAQSAATVAVGMGYTGDMCPDCLNLTMVRNGTCLKCDTCGSTTGCS